MFKRWFPMNYLIQHFAQSRGFIDPIKILARLRRFGHPSEVHEPIELVRAGVAFHARGLINTRAIQYNLDWVWPYWVVRQFKPKGASFIPRGFSFSHVNLTHRNWTAVGHPEIPFYPIVDPRGLVTPFFDGWSIDFWLLSENGESLRPSSLETIEQGLDLSSNLSVTTKSKTASMNLDTTACVEFEDGNTAQAVIRAQGKTNTNGWLIASIRPYNPEGIQFIDSIHFDKKNNCFIVNDNTNVNLDSKPEKVLFSNLRKGDVAHYLDENQSALSIECEIGMATSAAFFPIQKKQQRKIEVRMPIQNDRDSRRIFGSIAPPAWEFYTSQAAVLKIPDDNIRFLYDAALRTLLLLSAREVVPGPYTYKRFWFRDSCFMLNALLCVGMPERVWKVIRGFPERQQVSGYFQSQEGEWDSNGQVLWLASRYQKLTGKSFDKSFIRSLIRASAWIRNKRQRAPGKRHDGLLPPGFSAEHLGPNDYYYWDNFWSLAGLWAAGGLAQTLEMEKWRRDSENTAAELEKAIWSSLSEIPEKQHKGGIPASPYRRMDAGAIGSLVADYPLQITPAGDTLIMNTVSFLMEHCFYSGAFFQDMIHSGINIYLTLDIAQTLLRTDSAGFYPLLEKAAELASPTGQWPEAIHPMTGGGCMGDGQHGWAAAEWIMLIRNMFIREEGERMIVGSGILPAWLDQGTELVFGPTLIPGGNSVEIRIIKSEQSIVVDLKPHIAGEPAEFYIKIPGYEPLTVMGFQEGLRLNPII